MYARKFLSFAVSVTTVLAANETVKLFLPEFHGDSLVGKVIGMEGPLTTYVVNCSPRPTGQSFYEIGDCEGPAKGFTVTHGPSSFRGTFDYPHYTLTEDCKISASTSVTCTLAMDYGSTSTDREVMATVGPADELYQTLTVTATEIESRSANAQAYSTPAPGTPTWVAQIPTNSVASQSTNTGLPMATNYRQYAVGGAAAMAVMAMV